jgi:hypothetical protein
VIARQQPVPELIAVFGVAILARQPQLLGFRITGSQAHSYHGEQQLAREGGNRSGSDLGHGYR